MRGLDFTNERYIRVYTRDTADWLLLPWTARALYVLASRKLDRSGLLDLGKHDPAKAVAAVVAMPLDVVQAALPELLQCGLFEIHTRHLIDPVFLESQEARQSDAERARASRERRRARVGAVTIRDAYITGCDDGSRAVTKPSHGVTPSLAEPSLAEPESTSTCGDAPAPADPVARVFAFWQADTGHPKTKLDAKRRRRIKARLAEGFVPEDLEAAIRNRRNDPWLMGTDPKSSRVFDGIETLLRDAAMVERLRDLPQAASTRVQGGPYDDSKARARAAELYGVAS
ncbi:MAG: hypothetical protein IT384_23000 [Deltaproteobacteria bacterium]|nr:hypothetical protein [Deltaproteobacteria bacterium]